MEQSRALIITEGAVDLAPKLDALRHVIANSASTFEQVAAARDRARMIADATKRIAALHQAHQDAIEVEVRAVRRIGEELLRIDWKPRRDRKKRGLPMRDELGLSQKCIYVARSLATMPPETFDEVIAAGKANATLSLHRTYLQSKATRTVHKGGPNPHGSQQAEKAMLAASPSSVTLKNFGIMLRDSLRRLLARFDAAGRRRFLAEVRNIVAEEEERAAAGTPGARFDDDPKAAKPEPRLGKLPPPTDPKC